ncbi:hypothetical protein UM93_07715 [Psychromicrobium lacuslunae]|uniref:SAF domain-containing protein n=1 Tax=Psychromicrobium lacuslunae TaxID=1618207 RepID=A0A0D4C332_9MICC|nr:hypothetical protein UM93_07715 [Psychromicrobium lacuslunae]
MPEAAPINRLRKPSWKDPRLLIGVLLILFSVSAVLLLLGNAERTVEAFVSTGDIVVGQKLETASMSKVKVRLDELQGAYYLAADQFPSGAVAVQMIHSGQLIPKSSVAMVDESHRKPVAVTLEQKLPAAAQVGDRVDIWVAEVDPKTGLTALPQLILPSVEIEALERAKPGLMTQDQDLVYVLVDAPRLPVLLHALTDKAKLSVVLDLAGGHR